MALLVQNLLASFIFLIHANYGSGSFIVEVTLHTYQNPTGRCAQCQAGPDAGCCDESTVRPSFQTCPSSSACDPVVEYCNTEYIGGDCGPFSFSQFYEANANFLNLELSSSIFGEENTVRIESDEPWRGIQFLLVPRDCTVDDEELCGPNEPIDFVIITMDDPVGTNSPEQTYIGNNSIAQFTVSYTVRCAPDSFGSDCTGGDFPTGAVIGGVVGGILFLLCICVSCICIACFSKKKKTTRSINAPAPAARSAVISATTTTTYTTPAQQPPPSHPSNQQYVTPIPTSSKLQEAPPPGYDVATAYPQAQPAGTYPPPQAQYTPYPPQTQTTAFVDAYPSGPQPQHPPAAPYPSNVQQPYPPGPHGYPPPAPQNYPTGPQDYQGYPPQETTPSAPPQY